MRRCFDLSNGGCSERIATMLQDSLIDTQAAQTHSACVFWALYFLHLGAAWLTHPHLHILSLNQNHVCRFLHITLLSCLPLSNGFSDIKEMSSWINPCSELIGWPLYWSVWPWHTHTHTHTHTHRWGLLLYLSGESRLVSLRIRRVEAQRNRSFSTKTNITEQQRCWSRRI